MLRRLFSARRGTSSPRSSTVQLQLQSLEAREVPAIDLQVVHNSPYAAAALVDVYVNNELLIDDFAYKSAQSFPGLPAGSYLINITPGDSTVSVFSAVVNFADDERYLVVAAGDPLAPTGSATAFGLEVFAGLRSTSESGTTALLAFHGAPDAPEVSVRARNVATLVESFEFRDFAGYVTVPSADYTVDVTLTNGTIVRGFTAPLSGLAGQAVSVLATGFVDPTNTGTENSFGLLAVLADDTVVELPVTQVIQGTQERDLIFVTESEGVVSVSINGTSTNFLAATNPNLIIEALGGDDIINAILTTQLLTLDGGEGNDILFAGEGGNTLLGGDGDDWLFGGIGADRIEGGSGNDFIFAGGGQNIIRGGDGNDIIFANLELDDVDGEEGVDLIFG